MPRPDRAKAARLALVRVAVLGAAGARAEPAPYRYSAPIAIEIGAPFVVIALPPAVYGRVEQGDLGIVDCCCRVPPFN